MYEQFFNFSGKPFQLNPDPRFYFSSTGHKRAMAYMRYGLQQEQGFIIVTGDVGTGKSMLVSNLFNSMDTDRLVAAKVVSTNVQSNDLLRLICNELDIPHERRSKATLLNHLENRFRDEAASGKHVLLVIDEVQNLPRSSLEELRMLSNFEHDSKPLVQSFLLGQREFRSMLRAPGLEQLRQRVIAAYHLSPLSEKEIASYVTHRLKVAGWQNDPSIEDGVYNLIYKATKGVPRRINTFFDRVLLTTFLDESHIITVDRIEAVREELEEELQVPEAVDPQGPQERPERAEQAPPHPRAAAGPTPELVAVNRRLEGLERQMQHLTKRIGEWAPAREQPMRDTHPGGEVPHEKPRWTVTFAALSVLIAVGVCLAGYFVLAR